MRSFVKSFYFFASSFFFKKSYDVIFSYPVTFNRGNSYNNDLIEPFIDFCRKKNLDFLIFEESDLSGAFRGYKFSKSGIPLTAVTILEILLRKFLALFSFHKDKEDIERTICNLISRIFLNNISSKVVITLICHKAQLWRAAFPESDIYDYQHGIIFDGDWGYLLNGKPPSFRSKNRVNTLTYGKKISNLLINQDETKFYNSSSVFEVGVKKFKKLESDLSYTTNSNLRILFSMQDAADGSLDDLAFYYKKVETFFNQTQNFFIQNNIHITARHHPRANQKLKNNFLHRFLFIEEINENVSLESCLRQHNLHITFNSSSAIEASYLGVPTIFLELENPENGDFPDLSSEYVFYNQLGYPLHSFLVRNADEFMSLVKNFNQNDFEKNQLLVLDWVNELNNDFNYNSLIKIFSEKLELGAKN